MKHAFKIITRHSITFLLLASLLLLIPQQVYAAAGDNTTSGQLSLVSTIENISVIFSFDGDNNGNNQAFLYYRTTGASAWKAGIPMTADRRSSLIIYNSGTVTNPYRNQWRAIIFGLNPNTSYDVKVEYTDPDNNPTSSLVQSTIITRNDNPPSNGNVYHVAKNGNNGNDGSLASPWLTVTYAAGKVAAGDTVRIHPGTYTEAVTITKSGTSNNYITFESYDTQNKAVITNGSSDTINVNGADYNRFRYLDVRTNASGGHAIRLYGDVIGTIIEYCTLDSGSSGNWWSACIWLYGQGDGDSPSYTVIQNNTLDTSASSGDGPFGVAMYYCDIGGTVIKNNTFGTGFYDAIMTSPNFGVATVGHFYIYNNTISGARDDGIEIEGGGMNCGVWNNVVRNSGRNGIASAPSIIGPLYWFRNVISGNGGASTGSLKLGSSSYGYLYFYHNTFYLTGGSGFSPSAGSNSICTNAIFRNNIMEVSNGQYVIEEGSSGIGEMDFDYNSFYTDKSSAVKWENTAMSFTQWKAQEAGQEAHGVWGRESFVNAAGGNFHLQSGSSGIDKGVILPGFNDPNSPWPYSGSAPDMGAYEYAGGPVSDSTPPYTSGHSPAKGSVNIQPDTSIVLHVRDSGTGVDMNSIVMRVEGSVVIPAINGTKYDYTVTYNPPSDFDYLQVVNVTINARDMNSTPNVMTQDSYSFTIRAGDTTPPYTSGHSPAKGSVNVQPDVNITVHVRDSGDGVDMNSIVMRVEGSVVTPAINGTKYDYTVTYNPPSDFDYLQVVNVAISARDMSSTPNVMAQDSYSFTIRAGDTTPPYTTGHSPAKGSVDVPPDVNITVHVRDSGDGVDMNSIVMRVEGSVVTPAINGTKYDYTVTYNPPSDFDYLQVVNVAISARDMNSTPNVMSQDSYSFTIQSESSDPNDTPIANAGTDQYITSLTTVTLDGSASYDPDGDPISYSWSQISGPAVTLSSSTAAQPTFTPPDEGIYVFSLSVSDGMLISTTSTVLISVDTSLEGGGFPGGGVNGGGSVGDIVEPDDDTEITSLFNFATSGGKFNIDVIANSSDKNVEVYIPKDTVGTNITGLKLNNIVIKKLSDMVPSPPADAVIIGSVYDLTPNGARFNPTINLSMKYSSDQIPEGVAKKNLVIATFDDITGKWQALPSTNNNTNNTVTAQLEHFSTYSILAFTRPASFDVTQISTSSAIVACGSSVDIQAMVTNTGDLTGSYDVSCMIDDVTLPSQQVTLDGGDSILVTFSTTPEITGIYTAKIGLIKTTFTATEPYIPATFTTSSISVSPTEIYLGETVEISTLVSNIGDLSGPYEAILKLDNEYIDHKVVNISGGDSEIIIFTMEPKTEGEHAINIGDKVVFFEVLSVADVSVEIISAPDPEINRFDITPTYNTQTSKIESTRIDYQISNADQLGPDAELVLKIFHNGEIWEEIPLITLNQLEPNTSGHIDYAPSAGWDIGTYIFEAELKEQNGAVHSIQFEKFTLIEESITRAVSWGSLGIIIGGTLVVLLTVLAIVIYRRREMLRGYVE